MRKFSAIFLSLGLFIWLLSGCGGGLSGGINQPGSEAIFTPYPPMPEQPSVVSSQKSEVRGQDSLNLSAGWSTISFPYEHLISTSGFANTLQYYQNGQYREIDPTPGLSSDLCQLGFWAMTGSATTADINGSDAAGTGSVILQSGWNLIAFPLKENKTFADLTLTYNGETKTLAEVASLDTNAGSQWFYGIIQYYKNNRWYQLKYNNPANSLNPWKGYWVFSWLSGVSLNFVCAPHIDSIDPPAGATGILVTIHGSNFGSDWGDVQFDGISTGIFAWNDEAIVCFVPQDIDSPAQVVVQAGQVESNAAEYDFLIPHITGIEPPSGPPGTSVVLSGENFGEAGSQVYLNGYPVGVDSWADNRIGFTIPGDSPAGTKPVNVWLSDYQSDDAVDFTVDVVLTKIYLDPQTANLAPGESRAFTATGYYNDNSQEDLTGQVDWSCDNSLAGSIDASGYFTAAGDPTESRTANLSAGIEEPLTGQTFSARATVLLPGPWNARLKTLNVPADYPTIQAAVDAAQPGDVVLVAPGTYIETVRLKSWITLTSSQGPEVTTIKAGGGWTDLPPDMMAIEGDGLTHCKVNGFTLLGGDNAPWAYPHFSSGICTHYCDSTMVISNNIIRGKSCGVNCTSDSSPTITNNLITDSPYGIFDYQFAAPVITNNIITRNGAGGGGVISAFWPSPGGGIFLCFWLEGSQLINNTIINNFGDGLVFSENYEAPKLINNIVAGNGGYGIHWGRAFPCSISTTIQHNDFWNNSLGEHSSYGCSVSYINNLAVDPLLLDPANGNFNLQPGSSCIDCGVNDAPAIPDTDFAGYPRIQPGSVNGSPVVDFGALEHFADVSYSCSGIPGDSGWYRSRVMVKLSCGPQAAGAFYRLESGSWQAYTDPFAVSGEGVHNFSYYAIDGDGNPYPEKSGQLKIDALPPTISQVNISANRMADGDTALITASLADSSAGIDASNVLAHIHKAGEAQVYALNLYDDGTNGDVTPYDGIYTVLWNTGSLGAPESNKYFVDITLSDLAGNLSKAENACQALVYSTWPQQVSNEIQTAEASARTLQQMINPWPWFPPWFPPPPPPADTPPMALHMLDQANALVAEAHTAYDAGNFWLAMDYARQADQAAQEGIVIMEEKQNNP